MSDTRTSLNSPSQVGWAMLTPVATIVVSALLAAIILLAIGSNPITALQSMWAGGLRQESIIDILNRATPLYLAAVAVAIGFRMNIFNIGVEGQYILAALIAAKVGAEINLWAPLHLLVIILTAMAVGMAWVAVPAVLKITRGVHEVISTIMMNAIGVSFVAAILLQRWDEPTASLNTKTKDIPKSGRMPDLNEVVEAIPGVRDIEKVELASGEIIETSKLWGFLVVAIIVGALYHYFINRTRPGYDIRAGGVNPLAAEVAGISPKRTVLTAMLLSGAVAGLVGLPEILGRDYFYGLQFTQQLGFNGIAVALVGQNHAGGVALAALLFGVLDVTGPILDAEGHAPEEIVVIIKGTMIFTAIIVYAVARRKRLAEQARLASRVLAQRQSAGGAAGAAGAAGAVATENPA